MSRKRDAYSQYPGDLARTDSLRGQLNHFPPLGFWERSAVEKHPSQLVDASTTLTQYGIYSKIPEFVPKEI